ncbi:hypothetical protein [Actinoplanes sp. NPDC051851]|uniref:hypothetical protein n=1 Tax=Actinoplanes sp. NPDC051851 TaxID=3154753 RepID=UPI003436730B
MTEQRLTRRGLMVGAATVAGAAFGSAPAAGASAAGAASVGGRAGGDSHVVIETVNASGGGGTGLADAVVAAFRTRRVVAIGEVHGQQEHHDALQTLLFDPRLPAVVDDIVVEFGNALYQPTADRFVSGTAVEDRDLRLIWRDTTQSPVSTWDAPMYEQVYRTVRAVNWTLQAGERLRVLLGDPPIDWATVTREEVEGADRDGHMAGVVRDQVIAKGRRALILCGSVHAMHAPPGASGGGAVQLIEEQTGHRPYVILDGGHDRLAGHARRVVLPAEGSWLATTDSGEFSYFPGICGIPFGDLADALLYLGRVEDQTQSLWNPAIYLDPEYWAELERRKTLTGAPFDLAARYRQEQSVVWQVGGGPGC